MIIWVVYDIQNDKIRNKVAKISKQIGLHRVQKSVFLGDITKSEVDDLKLAISEIIDLENDSVYIFPMSKEELKITVLLGKAFDKQYVTNEVKQLFI